MTHQHRIMVFKSPSLTTTLLISHLDNHRTHILRIIMGSSAVYLRLTYGLNPKLHQKTALELRGKSLRRCIRHLSQSTVRSYRECMLCGRISMREEMSVAVSPDSYSCVNSSFRLSHVPAILCPPIYEPTRCVSFRPFQPSIFLIQYHGSYSFPPVFPHTLTFFRRLIPLPTPSLVLRWKRTIL